MTQYIAIIGGSGLYAMESFELREARQFKTPFGLPSSDLMLGTLAGVNVIFLARHGQGHVLNPSEINFRANMWALKHAGAKAVFSVSAVGSLREDMRPGEMVVIDQFIDRTRHRFSTFFENGIVAHVGLSLPVSSYLRELMIVSCRELKVPFHESGTYVCIEGPQFSTQAESHLYRNLGASVIGMTNMPEARLAREAEMDYATLALCTDYDCWHPEHDHVSTEQIIAVLRQNIKNAQKILKHAVQNFDFNRKLETEGVLKNAVLTDRKHIKPEALERLKPILGKYFL